MGRAVDPTYPLLPAVYCLSLAMLLLVLLTSFVRQAWNLGVTFLCFWLSVESVIDIATLTIWSDNADVKFWTFCDIISHLQTVTFVIRPMATLIITRRLYIIASFRPVELYSVAARRWNLFIEWTLGLIIPVLIAGPIYYIGQNSRFEVLEGFGCTNVVASVASILEILTIQSWTVIPPLVSVTVYYPRVVRFFYQQRTSTSDSFPHSDGSVSRTNYLRILALASIDILLTLPSGIVSTALRVVSYVAQGDVPFYPGWAKLHDDWTPKSISYADQQAMGTAFLAQQYFLYSLTPVLAFTIFGLFGLTTEARTSYRHIVCTVGSWFGWQPSLSVRHGSSSIGKMEFGQRAQETGMLCDAEMGMSSSSTDGDLVMSKRVKLMKAEDSSGEKSDETGSVPSEGERHYESVSTKAEAIHPNQSATCVTELSQVKEPESDDAFRGHVAVDLTGPVIR